MKKITVLLLSLTLILSTACNITGGNSPAETTETEITTAEIPTTAETTTASPEATVTTAETTAVPATTTEEATSVPADSIVVSGDGQTSAPETEPTTAVTTVAPVEWNVDFRIEKRVYSYDENINYFVENKGDSEVGITIYLVGPYYSMPLKTEFNSIGAGEKRSGALDFSRIEYWEEINSGDYKLSCSFGVNENQKSIEIPFKLDMGKADCLSVTHPASEGVFLAYENKDITFTFKNTSSETITLGEKIPFEAFGGKSKKWELARELPYTGKRELSPGEAVEILVRQEDLYTETKKNFDGRIAMDFTCENGESYKSYCRFAVQKNPTAEEPVVHETITTYEQWVHHALPATANPASDRLKAEFSTNKEVYGESGDIDVTVKNIGGEDFVIDYIKLNNDKGETVIDNAPFAVLRKGDSFTLSIPYQKYYYNDRIFSGNYKLAFRIVAMDLKDYRDVELPVKMDMGDARSLEIALADGDRMYREEDVTLTLKNISDKKLTLLDDAFVLRVYDSKSDSNWKWIPVKRYKCAGKNVLFPGETAEFTIPYKDALSGSDYRFCMLIAHFMNDDGEGFSNYAEFSVCAKDYGKNITLGE